MRLYDSFIFVKPGEAVDVFPNLVRAGTEVVRAIGMNAYSAGMLVVMNIAAEVCTSLKHDYISSRVGQKPRYSGASQTRADNHVVSAQRGTVGRYSLLRRRLRAQVWFTLNSLGNCKSGFCAHWSKQGQGSTCRVDCIFVGGKRRN